MQHDYKLGFRHGMKWAVSWLHEEAGKMNDPKARAILNEAAFHLGNAKKGVEPIIQEAASRSVNPPDLRAAIIEECAKVAESLSGLYAHSSHGMAIKIASAIRALSASPLTDEKD